MISPQTERLNKAINETITVLTNAGLDGGEYLFVLQTLLAAALAANKKSIENQFIAALKTDILKRRIESLKQ